MLAATLSRDPDPADPSVKVRFWSFRTTHSSRMLRERARPEIVGDNLGHVDNRVTQTVARKDLVERIS